MGDYGSGGRRGRQVISKRSSSGFRSTRRETMSGSSCTAGTSTVASTAPSNSHPRCIAARRQSARPRLRLGRDGLGKTRGLGFEGLEREEAIVEVGLGRQQGGAFRGAVERGGGLQRGGQRAARRLMPHRE